MTPAADVQHSASVRPRFMSAFLYRTSTTPIHLSNILLAIQSRRWRADDRRPASRVCAVSRPCNHSVQSAISDRPCANKMDPLTANRCGVIIAPAFEVAVHAFWHRLTPSSDFAGRIAQGVECLIRGRSSWRSTPMTIQQRLGPLQGRQAPAWLGLQQRPAISRSRVPSALRPLRQARHRGSQAVGSLIPAVSG